MKDFFLVAERLFYQISEFRRSCLIYRPVFCHFATVILSGILKQHEDGSSSVLTNPSSMVSEFAQEARQIFAHRQIDSEAEAELLSHVHGFDCYSA